MEYGEAAPLADDRASIRRPLLVVVIAAVLILLIMAGAVMSEFHGKAGSPFIASRPARAPATSYEQDSPSAAPEPLAPSFPQPITVLPPPRPVVARIAPFVSRPAQPPPVLSPVQPMPRPAPAPVSRPAEEVVIPLDQWTPVNTEYGSFTVRVHDHGVLTFTVWIGSGAPRRIEKQKGFETTATNIVQIHALAGAKVYYVDRIAVEAGHCVLKIVPQG